MYVSHVYGTSKHLLRNEYETFLARAQTVCGGKRDKNVEQNTPKEKRSPALGHPLAPYLKSEGRYPKSEGRYPKSEGRFLNVRAVFEI